MLTLSKEVESMLVRLNILKDNNVISEDVFDLSWDVYNTILMPLGYSDKKLETFVTHLAMASQRILNDDIANAMGEQIYLEVKNSDSFELAKEVLSEILSKTSIKFPTSEIEYLMLHLVNVLRESGGEEK